MKRSILFFLVLVLLVRIIYYTATEGFCPDRIAFPPSSCQTTDIPPNSIPNELYEATKSPFSYLKKGSQAYAFVSADSQYVLKLFKRHHMQYPKWVESVPCIGPMNHWRDVLLQKRQRKLTLAKGSYILATTKLRKQCGIVAAQLEPSLNLSLPTQLIDGIGRKHTVNIALCGYALQKKASLIFPSFEHWIKQKDIVSCQKAISSLLALITSRSQMGIEDVDPDIHKNAGLVNTQALFIDIGSFTDKGAPLSKEAFAYDLKKIFKEFRLFLSKKEPSLADFLDHAIEEEIARYTQT